MPEKTQDLAATIDGTAAAALLLFEHPVEVKRLAKAARLAPVAPDRWEILGLVQGRIRALLDQASYYSLPQMAAALGYGSDRLRQLTGNGIIKPVAKNKYHRDDTTRAFVEWQRRGNKQQTTKAAMARVTNARASEIEIRTSERIRKLIALEEAMESNALLCGFVRTEFGGLAARVTRDLALRHEIEKAVNDSLARIASRLIEEVAALENGRDVDDADGDDDAGSMGETESTLPADGGASRSAES